MSDNKNNTGGRRKQLSPAQCLARIKPVPPKHRFLISWDAQKKVLRYGCGDGKNEVMVLSNGRIEKPKSPSAIATKLRPECVHRLCSRSPKIKGAALINRVQAFLRRYLYLTDERLYWLLSVWIIATYVYSIFSHFGYLYLHSASPRCGKTRVEEILSHLCFEATTPLNSPTTPTIRETAAEGRTLVLDTLERWKGKNSEAYSAAMELLDAGFRNGGIVAKMVLNGDGNYRKEMFPVYAPYVLAAIKKDSLSDTALDRSFVVEMHQKAVSVKKQKYNFHRCEQECQPLRDDFYTWALQNAAEVARVYESPELEAEVDALELNDRAADIWKPLLAVARVLGNAEIWEALTRLSVEMGHDPEAAEQDRTRAIARSLRKLVNGHGAALGITSEFLAQLRAEGLEVEERELHGMLVQWGFSQESVRLEQGPRRAWELQDSKLAEIERENGGSPYPPVKR